MFAKEKYVLGKDPRTTWYTLLWICTLIRLFHQYTPPSGPSQKIELHLPKQIWNLQPFGCLFVCLSNLKIMQTPLVRFSRNFHITHVLFQFSYPSILIEVGLFSQVSKTNLVITTKLLQLEHWVNLYPWQRSALS